MRLVLLVLLSLIVVDQADAQRGRRRNHEPVELENFSYEKVEFKAPSLDMDEGECGVYLPAGYDNKAKRTYPWVIWLHGMNEDADRFHDGGGAKALDALRGEGKIREMILVAPSGPRRTIYANGEDGGDVADFILKDLVKFVEKKYQVSKERSGRALMGVSMGGMGALRFSLQDPEQFSTVAVHSAAAFPPDPTVLEGRSAERVQRSVQWLGLGELLGEPIDPKKWAKFIPSAIAMEKSPADMKGLRIFLDAGTEDRYGFGPPNEEFHILLEERNIEHSFTLVEGGGHSWGSGSMVERLAESLTFVSEGFAAEGPAVDKVKKKGF